MAVKSCTVCGVANVRLQRLMLVTDSGVAFGGAFCLEHYESALEACGDALAGVESKLVKDRRADPSGSARR